ncbi:hypothetical protein HELRODRAFT_176735 [Helobdella robusta]|uniref:Mediator of RNA polymerase II transcription subunit 28 n=1 Tax=Helobdella robusta TaxID=6412 RepID=T1FAU8_HELRO|nr:hypothetical protein HELRODRAFT_176735 [Helobdella robusta]ESN99567.1 hypothetical protein HELRODRAFT_176735 [Helobdella robusta]
MAEKPNLMEKFETAFHDCLTLMAEGAPSNTSADADPSELKLNVEVTFNKFNEAARLMENFFLEKQLILAADQDARENIEDLKSELERKECIIQRNRQKLQNWMSLANSSCGGSSHGEPSGAANSSSSLQTNQRL